MSWVGLMVVDAELKSISSILRYVWGLAIWAQGIWWQVAAR